MKTLTLTDIEELLKENKSYLNKRFLVSRIGVFGSYTCGKQTS